MLPPRRKDLCLLQNGLHGGVLKIQQVAVLAKNAFDENLYSRSRRLSALSINGSVGFRLLIS